MTTTWFERLRSEKTADVENVDADITITMSRELWQAVHASMNWPLADLGDHSPVASGARAHSERCFAAASILAGALNIPAYTPEHGRTT